MRNRNSTRSCSWAALKKDTDDWCDLKRCLISTLQPTNSGFGSHAEKNKRNSSLPRPLLKNLQRGVQREFMQHEMGDRAAQIKRRPASPRTTKEESGWFSEVGTSPAQWASLIKLTSLKTLAERHGVKGSSAQMELTFLVCSVRPGETRACVSTCYIGMFHKSMEFISRVCQLDTNSAKQSPGSTAPLPSWVFLSLEMFLHQFLMTRFIVLLLLLSL